MIRKNPAHDTETPAGSSVIHPTVSHWSERSREFKPGSSERLRLLQDEPSGSQGRKYNEWLANRANGRQEARKAAQAISPSTSAEERLRRLVGALEELIAYEKQGARDWQGTMGGLGFAEAVERAIKENT